LTSRVPNRARAVPGCALSIAVVTGSSEVGDDAADEEGDGEVEDGDGVAVGAARGEGFRAADLVAVVGAEDDTAAPTDIATMAPTRAAAPAARVGRRAHRTRPRETATTATTNANRPANNRAPPKPDVRPSRVASARPPHPNQAAQRDVPADTERGTSSWITLASAPCRARAGVLSGEAPATAGGSGRASPPYAPS
jgi:hypothetical protein